MNKLLIAFIPAIAISTGAIAACSDGATEKNWDKTASGYCKIFFPNCNDNELGKRVSYSREFADTEIICTGEKGQYTDFYKVSINDANNVFKTDFKKMGVNYNDELSKWLFDNCKEYCGPKAAIKEKIQNVSENVKGMAADAKVIVKEASAEKKEEAKAFAEKVKEQAQQEYEERKEDLKAVEEKVKTEAKEVAQKVSDKLNEADKEVSETVKTSPVYE